MCRKSTNLCFSTTVAWASDTRFRMLADFKAMTNNVYVFCPISSVDVKVEVGSNRSLGRLDLAECEECRTLFTESKILASVGDVRWSDISRMDYLKWIVSCIYI